MTYRIGPDLIEIYDEPQGPFCPVCGNELDWEDCDACGGEGEFDWETLQFDDPLWYQPGDTEPCGPCHGAGGWWWCPDAANHPPAPRVLPPQEAANEEEYGQAPHPRYR